jgi:OOP family OmpA-OmpF porin
MYKRLGLSTLAALALTATMAAQADVGPGFYAGVGFGTTKLEEDVFDGFDVDDSDTGFKFFGGYSFNENFAIEASYFDFGETSGRVDDTFLGEEFEFEAGVSGLSAAAVGRIPVGQTFALFGKIGLTSYDIDVSVNIPGVGGGSDSESESDLMYGVGAALSFADRFEARLEYEMINVDDGEASMVSLSGAYRF